MFNFIKKGVGGVTTEKDKNDREREKRKKEKKTRKEVSNISSTMSSEELLRLDEVRVENVYDSIKQNKNSYCCCPQFKIKQ